MMSRLLQFILQPLLVLSCKFGFNCCRSAKTITDLLLFEKLYNSTNIFALFFELFLNLNLRNGSIEALVCTRLLRVSGGSFFSNVFHFADLRVVWWG